MSPGRGNKEEDKKMECIGCRESSSRDHLNRVIMIGPDGPHPQCRRCNKIREVVAISEKDRRRAAGLAIYYAVLDAARAEKKEQNFLDEMDENLAKFESEIVSLKNLLKTYLGASFIVRIPFGRK